MEPATDHTQSIEPETIRHIIDENHTISELAYQGLCGEEKKASPRC